MTHHRPEPDLLAVAARWAGPVGWPVALRFDPTERWYARLAVTDEHEVWALSWLPGQGTDLHDHGGSSGAFRVVSGALTEETVSAGGLSPRLLTPGAGRRFGPRHVHQVTNRGADPAVSVHVYRPALVRMTRYHLVYGRLRVAEVAEAGRSW
ncbi:cysteine dioxygenase family protein [Micromonospora sp. WMMD1120]|uniref:cysteine dioxygenase n=1 Tax=Micromonospora sp. WMMD1120 TaxID=3016106 RepID=UPI002416F6C2|nr:cysteine dioxygenase family protein [Micromonospora sp. WMMD1120]MDG4809887.1 cysteine dioxygenase family protein [Micromonospora sp. WMMD1120]